MAETPKNHRKPSRVPASILTAASTPATAPRPQEAPLLTLAAARELLKTPQPLPPNAVRMFGYTINRLPHILQDPQFCELEAQLLSGSLTADEYLEWSTILPDAKRISNQLEALATQVSQFIAPGIPNLIQEALSEPGKVLPGDINYLFSQIVELSNSQRHLVPGLSGRTHQIEAFTDSLFEKISLGLYQAAFNQFGEKAAFRIANFLAGTKKIDRIKGVNKPFPGFNAVQSRYQAKLALKAHPQAAQEIFDNLNDPSVNFATAENFAQIDDLATLKKVIDATIETPKAKIRITSNQRYASLTVAFVSISLDKETIEFADGKERFLLENTLSFYLDRASGEIKLNGTEQTAEIVLGRKRYNALKNVVYKKLVEELEIAEFSDEELESSEEVAEPTAEKVITGVQAEIAETAPEAAPTLAKPKRRKRSKDEIRAENFHFGMLRGIKGNRLLGILEKLCNSEPQDGTSHRMFFSKITGTKISVPIHGDDQVGTGLMVKCLKGLELTPQEVYLAM